MKRFCKSKKIIWLLCAFVAVFLLCAVLMVALGFRTRGSNPIQGHNANLNCTQENGHEILTHGPVRRTRI